MASPPVPARRAPTIIAPNPSVPLGYFQYTLSGGAVTLATITGGTVPPVNAANVVATYAVITAETAGFRWRDDGTAPTASVGMPVPAGGTLTCDVSDLTTLRVIGQTTATVLNIAFYG
jgi:hypothetical protein